MARIKVQMTKKQQRSAADNKMRDDVASMFGEINNSLTDLKLTVENAQALMEHLDENHFLDSEPKVLRRAQTRIKRALEAIKQTGKEFQKDRKMLKVAVTAVDIDS